MNIYNDLDWDNSFIPLYGAPIILPQNTLLYRGYDISYPSISDRYAYYGSLKTASGYLANINRQLGIFSTSKQLKVLDLRFMKVLLSRLIHTNDTNKHFQSFTTLILSFGLCSLRHQIQILLTRYKDLPQINTDESKIIREGIKKLEEYYRPNDLVEQPGFRIAETTNDGYTMTFLKELFDGVIDGFISPRLASPFHVEKKGEMSAELIIFNPLKSGVVQLNGYPENIRNISINGIIHKNHGHIVLENKKVPDIKMNFYMSGGNGIKLVDTDFDILIHNKNKEAIKIYNQARKDGKRWREKMSTIYNIEAPTIDAKIVSPFPEPIYKNKIILPYEIGV